MPWTYYIIHITSEQDLVMSNFLWEPLYVHIAKTKQNKLRIWFHPSVSEHFSIWPLNCFSISDAEWQSSPYYKSPQLIPSGCLYSPGERSCLLKIVLKITRKLILINSQILNNLLVLFKSRLISIHKLFSKTIETLVVWTIIDTLCSPISAMPLVNS